MRNGTSATVAETMRQVAASGARWRRRAWIGGIILTLVVAAVVTVAAHRRENDALHYQTQPLQRGNLALTVSATGNLQATNQVEVGSELSGIITRMTADYNDVVAARQPLAYLDAGKYEAAVAKSRAEVKSAEARHQEARAAREAADKQLRRYRKTRELTGGKLPSLGDLEQAEAALAQSAAAVQAAAAAIEVAQATLRSNEADLAKTVIYAPISGIVLSRNVEPGQTVAASLQAPVLFVLAEDLRQMELQVDVDEADVGQVREGQAAVFTVDAYPERTFAARITQVRYGAETTEGVVTYKAVLSVENPDLLLRPGMTATAEITVLALEDALLVPNAALRFVPAEPSAVPREHRSLVDSLLPRPHRRQRPSKGPGGAGPAAGADQAVVHVLKDNRPVPVKVEKIATDGTFTAVRSTELSAGRELVVNALTTRP